MTLVKIKNEQVKYDNNHDVLHVFFPPMGLSVDDEEYPGIVIRRSVQDDRITGLTILDFSKRSTDILHTILPRYDFTELQV